MRCAYVARNLQRCRIAAVTVALTGVFAMPLSADRIYMKSGWDFDVDSWREEGDSIIYERFGGSITIKKADVLRIERRGEIADTTREAPGPQDSSARTPPTVEPVPRIEPVAPPPAAAVDTGERMRMLNEISRLRQFESLARATLHRREMNRIETEKKLLERGIDWRRAKAEADNIHREYIDEARRQYEAAQRRLQDLESQYRVKYGP
jgi:hypothetical protein